MVAGISSAMSRSLMALFDINRDIESTQNRINTGKKVSSPSDNIAVYFKAQSYTDKADLYENVNANITQATANLDYVDKVLANMVTNIKGARQMLSDARSKAVVASTAVDIVGARSYAHSNVTVNGTQRNIRGQIVDVAGGANVSDGSIFQTGDVFRVDFRDSSNNSSVTRFFRAVAPDTAALPDQNKTGNSVANAIEFNDLASLATALNLGLGRANASFDLVTNTANGTTTSQLSMKLNSNTQSITFGQVLDASVTVNGTATTGSVFDFTRLLQPASTRAATVSTGNSLDVANAPNAASWTYAPVGGATTDQTVIDARRQAADFFRQTIYGLQSSVRDAALPGFANILRGETMTVSLNDTNSVTQIVRLANAIEFSGGIAQANPYAMNLIVNGGTIVTAYTDTMSPTTSNFLSDGQLDNAIAKLDQVSILLGQQRNLIGASKTMMMSRLDLNKALVNSLSDTANEMTSADVSEESALLASLQNRQSFAATNLNITRQAEQFLLNLIR